MKISKVLLLVVSMVLIVSMVQAKIIPSGPNAGALLIPKISTSDAPVIGRYMANPIWRLVDATPMEYLLPQNGNYPNDWSDNSGWAKFAYDGTKLYALYYVQDDVVDSVTTIDWQMDGIEFYIDAANTHTNTISVLGAGHGNTSLAYQFEFRPAQKIDSVAADFNKGCSYRWILDTLSMNNGGPSGYFVEFSFNMDSLGLHNAPIGKKISLQLQLDDNDLTVDGRIHVMNWHSSPQNTDYQTTAGWGDAVLGDLISQNYAFLRTSTPPAIDGNLSSIWLGANQLTMDYLQPQGSAVSQDQDWRFYGLYDDTYLYGLFTVYDDIVDSVTTIDWQMDGVEVYTDAANTHTSTTSVLGAGHGNTSLAYQFEFRPTQNIDSVEGDFNKGCAYKWTLFNQGLESDTVFSTRSGYRVAFKFRLDSLGFTPADIASGTKVFSFQVQTDDNDLTLDGRVHTSNWWYSPLNNDYQTTAGWGNALLSSGSVAVAKMPQQIITGFQLAQNYPNPFNPSTQITFSLLKSEKVKLTVYNILGKQVAVLANEVRSAGSHTVTFDATNLASGVYFYKLEAGGALLAKKMMLLK